ncbi:unnamed protein product [Protopolystoma xenopodis]|uniref:Uncharacterized protein n=1 Tax=Protopolystoma xenopodis TaxID=117903 RepID=A0A3S4ZQB6_9PLAT|nr:unnamed protein product [Protopolystoma xenopodis]
MPRGERRQKKKMYRSRCNAVFYQLGNRIFKGRWWLFTSASRQLPLPPIHPVRSLLPTRLELIIRLVDPAIQVHGLSHVDSRLLLHLRSDAGRCEGGELRCRAWEEDPFGPDRHAWATLVQDKSIQVAPILQHSWRVCIMAGTLIHHYLFIVSASPFSVLASSGHK